MTQRIVIVGGGIIGTSTLYQLALRAATDNLQLTLVEGSSIAAGASGKAGGLLALDWHGPATASLAALSYGLHAQLAKVHDGPSRWGYRQLHTLSVSADFQSVSKGASARPTGTKTPKQHEELFPWLSRDVLRDSEVLGSPETTAQVHPEQFTRAMVDLAREKAGDRVKIVYGTAESLSPPSSPSAPYTLSVRPRDSPSDALEQLEADALVIAAGPWTGRLLTSLGLSKRTGGAKPGRAADIRGSRAHSVVVRPPDGKELPAQALFTSIKTKGGHAEPEIYNRPDGTSYACGPTDGSDLPTHASSVTVDSSAIALLLAQTAQLAPDHLDVQKGAKVEREQACYLPVGSGDPVIGRIEGTEKGRGVFVASGHSCWGICNGPGTGLVLSELILDGKAKSADISRLGP
ncbi:hypothetical protein JCM8097_006200 [Rhodosporidiobolus ruineniae]